MKRTRRNILVGALAGAPLLPAQSEGATRKVYYRNGKPKSTPLFPSAVVYGNLVFVSGQGVSEGDVRTQTARTLDNIEKILQGVGSSMPKVLKCNVYLTDIRNFGEMNEAYLGRFGPEPPARTTLAVAAIPLKGCQVEIEAIACL